MNMVKSRLLGRNTLSSTIIGVVPREPDADVSNIIIIMVNVAANSLPSPVSTSSSDTEGTWRDDIISGHFSLCFTSSSLPRRPMGQWFRATSDGGFLFELKISFCFREEYRSYC